MNLIIAAMLLFSSQAIAQEEPSEQLKTDALRLGYQLNGNSMVRWGSIDLTTIINPTYPYIPPAKPELIGPPAPPKKEDKR